MTTFKNHSNISQIHHLRQTGNSIPIFRKTIPKVELKRKNWEYSASKWDLWPLLPISAPRRKKFGKSQNIQALSVKITPKTRRDCWNSQNLGFFGMKTRQKSIKKGFGIHHSSQKSIKKKGVGNSSQQEKSIGNLFGLQHSRKNKKKKKMFSPLQEKNLKFGFGFQHSR